MKPSYTRVNVVFFLLTLLSLGGLLSACGGGGDGWTQPPPVVETRLAALQPWAITYTTTGTLEANNKVDLNTEAPGTISHIYVREGQAVGRGQVLMRLKQDKVSAQVQQSAAGVTVSQQSLQTMAADIRQAQARVDAAQQRRNLAHSELQRYQRLYDQEFISQLELDQKRTNYDTAESAYQEALQQLSAARARLGEARASVAQARSNLSYSRAIAEDTVIRAPFSGVIGQKYVDIGDFVAPTEKLITVVDPSVFHIQFSVPERYLGRLQAGLPVKVAFEGLDNVVFSGSVQFIDPVLDPETRTVTVKAALSDPTGRLRHGMFGNVSLTMGTVANAVVIPEEALLPQGEKNFVYVVKKGTAYLRPVTVGYREAGKVQVAGGLRAGERIVVSGLQKVRDGIAVRDKAELPKQTLQKGR